MWIPSVGDLKQVSSIQPYGQLTSALNYLVSGISP